MAGMTAILRAERRCWINRQRHRGVFGFDFRDDQLPFFSCASKGGGFGNTVASDLSKNHIRRVFKPRGFRLKSFWREDLQSCPQGFSGFDDGLFISF